jgi:hypothetical protein
VRPKLRRNCIADEGGKFGRLLVFLFFGEAQLDHLFFQNARDLTQRSFSL